MAGLINHGIFEIMQGYQPTGGFFIEAIGESHRFWKYGTEGAITIIPNFLLTGIMVLITSIAIIIWAAKHIDQKNGAKYLLILFILLTLFGGGLGHIILFLPTWAYTTRINKSLNWWSKILTGKLRKFLSYFWLPSLLLTSIFWIIVMQLGIFGYFPGETDPEVILNIVFLFLILTVLFANITFICGFAGDILARESASS
jgi:hypothetical protein